MNFTEHQPIAGLDQKAKDSVIAIDMGYTNSALNEEELQFFCRYLERHLAEEFKNAGVSVSSDGDWLNVEYCGKAQPTIMTGERHEHLVREAVARLFEQTPWSEA